MTTIDATLTAPTQPITVARQLEAEGKVRLPFDQEAWRRGIRSTPLPPELHTEIEGELRARLLDLAQHGADVVPDSSFLSRSGLMARSDACSRAHTSR